MTFNEHPVDQVRSRNYPKDHSWIEFDATSAGFIDAQFKHAIQDHGNDSQFTWHSYAENSSDDFTVELLGDSEAPLEQTDYYQLHRWELELRDRRRKLVIDNGLRITLRFEGEFLIPGTLLDVSDLIAASLSLGDYNEERREQGWDPNLDDMLRSVGLI